MVVTGKRNLLFVIPALPRARLRALLAASKGESLDVARRHLAEARTLARGVDATILLGRIEALQSQLASR